MQTAQILFTGGYMGFGSMNVRIGIKSAFIFLLLFTSAAYAVNVKFSVEMKNHINGGLFSPTTDKVYLRGNFNNWDLSCELQRVQGTDTYSSTVSLPENHSYEFKYYISTAGAANNGWEENTVGLDRDGNRILQLGANSLELAVMYFNNSNMSLKRETKHFLFYCDPADMNILDAYESRLESEYSRITGCLEATVGTKIHVELFKDLKTLHTASGYPEDPDWATGSAIGKTVIISVSPNALNEPPATTGLLSVISHEFVHIVNAWKKTVELNVLISEGTAMYLSDFPFVRSTTEVREFIKELGHIPTFAYFENNFINHGYAFSATVADFIVTKHGMHALACYVGNAVPSTLGYASLSEFESAWQKFLKDYFMPEENLISKEKASTAAVNWYRHWNPDRKASGKVSGYQLIEVYNMPQMHLFTFDSGGFVLIAATDRVSPIIGYDFSTKAPMGTFFYRDLFCSHMNDIQTPATIKKWNDLLNNDFSSYGSNHVTPMLTTHWHQWWPYNAYYPADPVFFYEENGKYRTGCGPLAAAQLTKYWNFPEKPRYHVSIDDPGFGKFTMNYDTVRAFDWKNMPDFLPVNPALPRSSYDASAYLMYNLVVGGIHWPGAGGGGSCSNWAGIWAIYFNYCFNSSVIKKENYTIEQWKHFFDTELENGRPMLIAASTDIEGRGGHYFIIDGSQAGEFYHINLGWADINGYVDGYYPIDNLGGFGFNNMVLIGLEPQKKNIEIGGIYQNDEHTVALFHFNGNLDNAAALSGKAVQHGSGISFVSNDSPAQSQCLRIDNSSSSTQSYLTVPHSSGLDMAGSWTIEAWVNINSWGNSNTGLPCLLNKSASEPWESNYQIMFNPPVKNAEGKYLSSNSSAMTSVSSNDSTIELHKWYHVAYIRDVSTHNVKVLVHNANRELIYYYTIPYNAFTEANPRLNANELFIGWMGKYSNSYYDGYIDELRISNIVRDFSASSVSYVTTYPGDADDDGIVRASDILPLGFYYGKSGAPRSQSEQGCGRSIFSRTPWDAYRAAFADCNGDGTVDVADILCIGYNYNQTSSPNGSSKRVIATKKNEANNPFISLSAADMMPAAGDTLTDISIKLSNAEELLGMSFDLSWDNEILEIVTDESGLIPGNVWKKDALMAAKLFGEKGVYELGITNRAGNAAASSGEVITLKARVKKTGDPRFKIRQAYWTDINGEKYAMSLDANLTDVEEDVLIPKYELTNFPNPFNPSTQIKFSIANSERMSLKIFNSLGQQTAVLVNGEVMKAGEHSVTWSAAEFASGVYFCRLETANKILTRKLMVIK